MGGTVGSGRLSSTPERLSPSEQPSCILCMEPSPIDPFGYDQLGPRAVRAYLPRASRHPPRGPVYSVSYRTTRRGRRQMSPCTCHRYEDGSRSWREHCPAHGREAIMAALLPSGTRIRSVRHPELTGYIKGYEFTRSGMISPIPYCIGWDDSPRAAKELGMLFVYATVDSIEAVPVGEDR